MKIEGSGLDNHMETCFDMIRPFADSDPNNPFVIHRCGLTTIARRVVRVVQPFEGSSVCSETNELGIGI